jgi:hypothetical protein
VQDGTAGGSWFTNGASGQAIGTTTNHAFQLFTNSLNRINIAAAGNVTVNAPSSGTSLVINNLDATAAFTTVGSVGGVSGAWYSNSTAGVIQFGASSNHGVQILSNNTNRIAIAATGGVTLQAPTSGTHQVNQGAGAAYDIGYRNLPQSASTTAATTDVGKSIVATSTITIPNSTFAAGDCFTIYNNSAAAITLTCNTTTTRIAGTATTGATRTLALRGQCTAYFLSATELILSGNVT